MIVRQQVRADRYPHKRKETNRSACPDCSALVSGRFMKELPRASFHRQARSVRTPAQSQDRVYGHPRGSAIERLSILIITTDQQRWDKLGINGSAEMHTPNLDLLARQGMNLDQGFAQNPFCTPGRASFLAASTPLPCASDRTAYQHRPRPSRCHAC